MPQRYCPPNAARLILLTLLGLAVAFGTVSAGELASWTNPKAKLESHIRLAQSPGGMTFTPSGSMILSLHQYQGSSTRVAEITKDEKVYPFPNKAMSTTEGKGPIKLDSVLGIQSDKDGIVWMLDNGRRSETTPKLVAWDTEDNVLHKVIYLPAPATIATSFLNDLALNPEEPYIYISDPAAGKDAALIVVNKKTGLARRLLQSHYTVIPESRDIIIDAKPVFEKRVDGTKVRPFDGVNPIAVDRKGTWVYFGSTNGRTLYRIKAADLHDETLSPEELVKGIDGWATKPVCDSISIDSKGNVYVSDLKEKAIGIIDPKSRKYTLYVRHPDFLWLDGLCFGKGGDRLYFYASKVHLMPKLNNGRNGTNASFEIFKIKPLADGTMGR